MSWDFSTTTVQKANKEYHCDAASWIKNSDVGTNDFDFTEKDLATVKKAKSENWKIKKGTIYIKTTGMWDGEFSVFKARIDLNEICINYDIYEE